ncbi:MAG: DEAD/DEAH box helicase, partial [Microcystaceae cyanobacterium]
MSLDHAALFQASQKVPSSLPTWLEVDQFVYWKEKNSVVRILGYIGRIVKIDNGGDTFSVESEQLAQLEPSNHTHDLSAISHLPFRELAQQYLDELGQVRLIGGTEPDLRPLPVAMHPSLQAAFKQVGIEQFYSHQLQAWAELEQGHSLALVTDTASGKSNCFIPMAFQQALSSAKTTLLIYPLKALALDQTEKLVTLNQSLPETLRLKIARCTGDVPLAQRKAYFQGTKCPDVILASPDVLHHLLYRTSSREFELWREFLKRLQMIVIDEAHSYISSFGIHLANVMRRLRLACDYAGGKEQIQWVVSTATLSNPLELASQFTAQPEEAIALIEHSGARRHERTLLSFKPQAAPNYLVASLVNRLSHLGLKSLVFVNARQSAKALYSLIHVQTKGLANIDIFHGSLLAAKRHNLLERFSRGDLRTLISTNCLECGIDLPAIDVV